MGAKGSRSRGRGASVGTGYWARGAGHWALGTGRWALGARRSAPAVFPHPQSSRAKRGISVVLRPLASEAATTTEIPRRLAHRTTAFIAEIGEPAPNGERREPRPPPCRAASLCRSAWSPARRAHARGGRGVEVGSMRNGGDQCVERALDSSVAAPDSASDSACAVSRSARPNSTGLPRSSVT